MPIPRNYAVGGEAAIATYDYTDIAEGTGVVKFQGFTSISTGTTVEYHLGTAVVPSARIEDNQSTYDFDLAPFNMPTTIKGTATINFSTLFDAASTNTFYYVITIQKVELDANVVDLGTVTTDTITWTSADVFTAHCVRSVLTETHFKKGETLRLKMVLTKTGEVYLGTDPANRNGTKLSDAATYPTKLEAHIPFKLDL